MIEGLFTMNITLIPLKPIDSDLTDLVKIHSSSSVAKYISISDSYFEYVTSSKGVTYYKIIADDILVGGIHCEINNGKMCFSVCIDESYRRRGIAETAIRKLLLMFSNDVKDIEVNVENTNTPSLSLFKKLGFAIIGKEDELIKCRLQFH